MDERFLCRGKRCDTDDGNWIEGLPTNFSLGFGVEDGIQVLLERDGHQAPVDFPVDPATMGRCVGIRDKTGKMLFEGDIFKTHSGTVASVYSAGIHGWYYKAEFYGNICGMFGYMADGSGNTDMEIIGNVHDNPELLAKR